MARRAHLSLKTKLACLIIEHFQIDRQHAREMGVENLLSLIQFDHIVYHTWTQDDDPANLTPILILDHRTKSSKDKSVIAKASRISAKEEDFRRRILAKTQPDALPPQAKKKYQWAKGRKLQSRNTLRRRKP